MTVDETIQKIIGDIQDILKENIDIADEEWYKELIIAKFKLINVYNLLSK
jgi:hypothetical protein